MASKAKTDDGVYDSAFEDETTRISRKTKDEIYLKNVSQATKRSFKPSYDAHWQERSKELPLLALDAYSRHKELINHYHLYHHGGLQDFRRNKSSDKTDLDVLRENHKFVWPDDLNSGNLTWEQRLAKKYYEKLFKEYCVADLTRYKENKIGMRWRIEKEVVEGKGQFFCGSKHCNVNIGLKSWEVNFAYKESGERKNALVKLRLCPDCSYKLNYRQKKKEIIPKLPSSKEHKSKRAKVNGSEKEVEPTEEAKSSVIDDAEKVDADVWSQKPQIPVPEDSEEKREEEFDDFFQDLFL